MIDPEEGKNERRVIKVIEPMKFRDRKVLAYIHSTKDTKLYQRGTPNNILFIESSYQYGINDQPSCKCKFSQSHCDDLRIVSTPCGTKRNNLF